jgi:hypothetical protein
MPPPLDAPSRHPYGLHPAGMKEGSHRIMKVAASPRPRILEPRLRLPVRPFSPACAEPSMASADFCEPFKIPYGIFSRHRQDRRPPRVRTAAFPPHPPHLLHHRLMVMGFALSCKLTRVIQPDMRFVLLRSAFCLRLPSDPTSRWTPLPSASSFHHQDLQGTSTPKLLPMPGTHKYPPAEPEVLRLLAPQRGLTAIGKNQDPHILDS